jgi:hypothetical protein
MLRVVADANGRLGRDPYIEQAIQEARERQESWERWSGRAFVDMIHKP